MQATTKTNTTSTRRGALGLFGSAIAAGLAVPALASAAASPDEAIISTCNELIDLRRQIEAVGEQCRTVADEGRAERKMSALVDRQDRLEERLPDLPKPTSPEGVRALARVAFARWYLVDEKGRKYASEFDEWLSLSVVELVGG
jgi:hypothetical protein